MSRSNSVIYFILLVTGIILLTGTKAYHDELSTTIENEHGIKMQFKWVKRKPVLANSNLVIFRAKLDSLVTKDNDVMETIGNFEMYHDVDKSSAIMYMERPNCIFGIIDTRYLIIDLPVDKLGETHIVGKSEYIINLRAHVESPDHTEIVKEQSVTIDPEIPSTSNTQLQIKKRPYTYEKEHHSKHDTSSDFDDDESNLPFKKRSQFYETEYTNRDEDENTSDSDPLSAYETDESNSLPKKHSDHSDNEIIIISDSDTLSASENDESNLQSEVHTQRHEDEKPLGPFYPEILLLVSHDIVQQYQRVQPTKRTYLKQHTIYYLIYMNAVAMLFAKLSKDIEIYINIAGIIFEEEAGAFPFGKSQYINGQLVCPTSELVSHSIITYINNIRTETKNHLMSEDSFDFFLFSTNLNHAESKHQGIIRGLSTEWFDIFEWRSYTKRVNIDSKYLGSIVDYTFIQKSYVDAAHEIAHLMNINDDKFKSHALMQEYDSHQCPDCLNWSPESINAFKNYFRNNKNRCYLMNEPRSIYIYGIPRETLSENQQCECYGLLPRNSLPDYSTIARKNQFCQSGLHCLHFWTKVTKPAEIENSMRRKKIVPRPVDGTRCDNDKVCWAKKCVPGVLNA